MTPPAAQYPSSSLPNTLVLRSRDTETRLIICFVFSLIISLLLDLLIVLLFTVLGLKGPAVAISPLLLIAIPLNIAVPSFYLWKIVEVHRACTVVNSQGLRLQQSKQFERFIPWEDAHGRIAVKTVSQYTPGANMAIMSLIFLKMDHEELVLPGTLLNSNRSYAATATSYATAIRILAYDPWGQHKPLIDSENTFMQAPQNII